MKHTSTTYYHTTQLASLLFTHGTPPQFYPLMSSLSEPLAQYPLAFHIYPNYNHEQESIYFYTTSTTTSSQSKRSKTTTNNLYGSWTSIHITLYSTTLPSSQLSSGCALNIHNLNNNRFHTPQHHSHAARNYPASSSWSTSNDAERQKLEDLRAIELMHPDQVPLKCKPISLTMSYMYNSDEKNNFIAQKSRFSLRGDTMKPNLHYDPENTGAFTSENSSVRTTFKIPNSR